MEQIIQYFESIPSLHRTIILVSGLTLFWILEGIIPILNIRYKKVKHAGVNLFFTLTTLIINLGFAFLILETSDWAVDTNFGILNWIAFPVWLKLIVGICLLDLVGAYFIHWLEHKVYWMWKFHLVHHTDTHVDTTTALRHHPGESVFRATFTILAVFVTGAPMWVIMIYQSLSAFLSQFNHANLKLPILIEHYLKFIIVTPNMHRIHHHFEQPYTDRNYGNIFSIWDRLFKTFAKMKNEDIVFGLDVYNKRDGNVGDLLKAPLDGENYHREV